MRVLGIDPGIERIGFGLIETDGRQHHTAIEWGLIHTHKDNDMHHRLAELYADAHGVFTHLKPDWVCIEKLFFFRNQTTIISVAQARGVLLLLCGQFNVPYQEFTPMQVKQRVTGYGKAEKKEVQTMVQQMLKLEKLPKPDDVADALALALCFDLTLANDQLQLS
jgi:crossover junction endodeoxyribonuclease RuvC